VVDVRRDRREQAAVLALCAQAAGSWHLVAQLIEETGSALRLANGDLTGFETPEFLDALRPDSLPVEPAELERQELAIDEAENAGATLVTVLDEGYPTNLRSVYDRPPFLFVRGRLEPGDERAIAVVGTRRASDEGLRQADRLARGLVDRGVTVVSGLAAGIDTAAHEAALAAAGRTVAVMGTGIRRVYPRENAELAERIVASGGALLSQFWPDSPPTRYRFPMRNRTMSGLARGTVVVEASDTSGARMQARIALEHGRRVFLFSGLVTREPWAQRVREHPAATEVSSADDVLKVLDALEQPVEQLTLA
jgi:DNA processing protein